MGNRAAEPKPPSWAKGYLRVERKADARGQSERRDALLAGLRGSVIEIGCGHGPNFSHYPREVSGVVAVEPEPALRRRAEEAAESAPVPVTVLDATAEALPGDDGAYDAAVCALVLCSVPSQAEALAEIGRVLRPGGELRYYEHVVSARRPVAVLERAADVVWSRLSGGCHMSRDTERSIREAGFEIRSTERFGFAPTVIMPSVSHVLGVAVRVPAGPAAAV